MEKLIFFKELEQRNFRYVYELGCEITGMILESYDKEFAAARDTGKYCDKGIRKMSIKTVYGPVEYKWRVYQTILEDGKKAYVYLLDEAMQMDKIGLVNAAFWRVNQRRGRTCSKTDECRPDGGEEGDGSTL